MPAQSGAGELQPARVRSMFDGIAPIYDALNTAMTAGLHHRWRERAADEALLGPGDRVLDVATGTGDLALELARRVSPGGEVVGSDFSEAMLAHARVKAARTAPSPAKAARTALWRARAARTTPLSTKAAQADARQAGAAPARAERNGGSGAGLRFEWGDALRLPYSDDSFDAATVGFGVRNFSDRGRGLAEMTRVVRPGGRVVILEFTSPVKPPLSWFYGLWFDRIVPVLGRLSPDPAAYSYLPDSVRRFPAPAALAAEMQMAGLQQIRYLVTAGGIVTIHVGVVAAKRS